MIRNLLILPDGSEVFSGTSGQTAIRQATLTQRTGDDGDLVPGAVCAAQVELELYVSGDLPLSAGDRFTLCHVLDDGSRNAVGIFDCEKPERTGKYTCRITALDPVRLLDTDLTDWLRGLTGWPYSLQQLAEMVCRYCGIAYRQTELPNGSYLVSGLACEGITGRQLMAWIGQLTGRFCRADSTGTVEFAWYTPCQLTVGPTGEYYYFQDSLQYADYTVAPVEKVQLQLTAEDVGTVYPDVGPANTMILTGNYLLGDSEGPREALAQSLYEQFRDITYTPGTLTVPAHLPIACGQILTVNDGDRTLTMYIVSRTQTGQKAELTATGNPRRDTVALHNGALYKAFTGRVLELKLELEGLRAENRNAAGDRATLELELEGITAEVARQQVQADSMNRSLTSLRQTADGVALQVERLRQEGTDKLTTAMGYTFDDTGLHISRDDSPVATAIDESGMEVTRSGENVLRATAEGVKAIDITVENYLMVGSHARFENFPTNRTACFYVE